MAMTRTGRYLGLVTVLAVLNSPATVRAAVLQVPSSSYPNLQTALSTAPDNSVIIVAPGTYKEALSASTLNKILYFKSSGGADSTIIDGENTRTLLYVMNGSAGDPLKNLTFDGFTFKRGKGATSTSPITIADASPQFINCKFTDNSATDKGGAVLAYSIYNVKTYPLFVNCVFQNNRSDQWGGAALIGNGGVMTTPHVQAFFKDCRFLTNTTRTGVSTTSQGGALAFATASGKIVNCEFEGNTSAYAGGAIAAYTMFADSYGNLNTADVLEVKGSVFKNNHCDSTGSPPTEGGAVHSESNITVKLTGCVFTNNYAMASGALNSYRANLEVTNCVFDGNTAVGSNYLGFGGAIGTNNNDVGDSNRREASLTISGTLIRNSTAPVGGGISLGGDGTYNVRAPVSITNTTIENCRSTTANSSYGHGGGLYLGKVTATLSNVAILNNTAENAGGGLVINEGCALTLNNSWIIGNSAVTDAVIHNPTSLSYTSSGTTIAYNSGSGTASLAVLSAIPPVTLQGTDYLTYIVAPYGSPSPSINQGVGTPTQRGSNPNYYAAGTASASGISADTTFTLTSSGSADKLATVIYVPNGVTGVPYLGAPVSLPGRIEAENFDNGGEAVAYHDLDTVNSGGTYRVSEGVDMIVDAGFSNGYGIGWTQTGEWLEYSVKAATGGCYKIEARVASPTGGSFSVQVDGTDVTGIQTVPNTGGYASWQTLSASISLTVGTHRLRLIVLGDNWNLDYLQVSALGNSPPVAEAGGPYTTIDGVGRTLWATQSSDPDQVCGDSIVKYEWDLKNDGNFVQYYAGTTVPWSQIVADICSGVCTEGVPYTITLRVTDGSGLKSTDSTTFTVVPKSTPPNDYDADGKSDFGAYYPATGAWTIYKSTESSPYTTTFGYEGTSPVSGDFDGDGLADFGCYYAPLGKWYLFKSAEQFYETQFGYEGTIPIVGDFDGDGKTDFGCYYAPLGKWYIYKSKEGFYETQFGYKGTIPIVGDFDGDGKTDFGCYYAPLGKWYMFRSGLGFWETQFGYDGTIPVVGDFDGDGKTDIGCYYPPGGNWYLFRTSEGFFQTQFGYAGTLPVVGDYDGDGLADFGVFNSSTGDFYVFQSKNGFKQTTYGFVGTYPLGGVLTK